MNEKIQEKLLIVILVLIFVTVIVLGIFNQIRFYRTVNTLKSMGFHHVTLFRIYPTASMPDKTPVEFITPDPIIDDFLQSVTDLRAYWGSPGSVASFDHEWFVEIVTEEDKIQMSCYIPAEKDDIVLGEFGKFSKGGGGSYYGDFQSRLLYQWYQKYSHRWLNPALQQDTGG